MPPPEGGRYTHAVPAFAGIDLAWTVMNDSGICIVRGERGHLELVTHEARPVQTGELRDILLADGTPPKRKGRRATVTNDETSGTDAAAENDEG